MDGDVGFKDILMTSYDLQKHTNLFFSPVLLCVTEWSDAKENLDLLTASLIKTSLFKKSRFYDRFLNKDNKVN